MTDPETISKGAIARDWLPRYTGLDADEFGDYVLLTNFKNYVDAFAERFDCEVKGLDRPMQSASAVAMIVGDGQGEPGAPMARRKAQSQL